MGKIQQLKPGTMLHTQPFDENGITPNLDMCTDTFFSLKGQFLSEGVYLQNTRAHGEDPTVKTWYHTTYTTV